MVIFSISFEYWCGNLHWFCNASSSHFSVILIMKFNSLCIDGNIWWAWQSSCDRSTVLADLLNFTRYTLISHFCRNVEMCNRFFISAESFGACLGCDLSRIALAITLPDDYQHPTANLCSQVVTTCPGTCTEWSEETERVRLAGLTSTDLPPRALLSSSNIVINTQGVELQYQNDWDVTTRCIADSHTRTQIVKSKIARIYKYKKANSR